MIRRPRSLSQLMTSASRSIANGIAGGQAGGGGGYTPTNAEATALFARMSVQPSNAVKAAYDDLYTALKTNSILSSLNFLHVGIGPDAQASALDIVDLPGTGAFNMATGGGAPVYTANRGWYTDGVDDFTTWNWDPATNGASKWTQNSAFWGIWTTKVAPDFLTDAGTQTSADTLIATASLANSGAIRARLNQTAATSSGAAQTNAGGFTVIERTGASAGQVYKNGAASGSAFTETSAALSSVDLGLGKANNAFGENQFWFNVGGAALGSTKQGQLYTALAAFAAVVGCAVEQTATLSLASSTTLPDGATASDAGKGFTCTGLARDADGTWWVANFGAPLDPPGVLVPSIVHLSADFTTILGEVEVVADLGLAATGIQGVTVLPSGNIAFIQLGSPSKYVVMTPAGVQVGSTINLPNDENGLTYDTTRDQVITYNTTSGVVTWRDKTTLAAATSPGRAITVVGATFFDQLHYDAANDQLITTQGASGSAGIVKVWEVGSGTVAHLVGTYTLTGADAIEGIVAYNGIWYVCNDAYYHGVSPALNRILQYTAPAS
jgi:hypothetical protein